MYMMYSEFVFDKQIFFLLHSVEINAITNTR